jgi:hypothetical protein
MPQLDLQQHLAALLASHSNVRPGQVPAPVKIAVPESYCVSVLVPMYRSLGGQQSSSPARPGGWDLEFDSIAVELDEDLHFNRYRALTLESPLYQLLPDFPRIAYARFCAVREKACLNAGRYLGKWTNASSARKFGQPAPCGDLSANGSPRWRQRAFYDFFKDGLSLISDIRVARIAIWDSLEESPGSRMIRDILRDPAPDSGFTLAAFVRRRAGIQA